MFNPTLVPPAPEVPVVPDGSQSGEVRPAVLVSRFTRCHRATTELCSKNLNQPVQFCLYVLIEVNIRDGLVGRGGEGVMHACQQVFAHLHAKFTALMK